MRRSQPQQKECREQRVYDSDAIDHITVSAELERPVRDMLSSSTFQYAKNDRSDLESFTFRPPSVPVTKESMNYSCIVYGGVITAGLVYYVLRARKRYAGPSLESSQEM
jgi:hypothetical protein